MKHLIWAAVVVLSGCTGLSSDIDWTRDRLILAETRAKLQSVRLQMCKERSDHSIRCAAGCKISKAWHKQVWNKEK